MPPADVADEARVVQAEALTAEGRGGLAAGVGEKDLVDLARLGIGDDGATGRDGIEPSLAILVAVGRQDVLRLDHGVEALPRRRGETESRAQGDRIGGAESGLLHAFVAKSGVE